MGERLVPSLLRWPRSMIGLAILALVAASCAGGDRVVSTPSTTPSTSSPGPVDVEPQIIVLAGTFAIPGATGFGDPGFHASLFLTGVVPDSATGVTGELVVRLRDSGRPDQTCARDHPLSGCMTVDWSDFEGRPSVPAGGVFDNRLSLVSPSGAIDLFMSETRGLAGAPDAYSPT